LKFIFYDKYLNYFKKRDCYTNELAPKCFRCNEAIIENFISALNSYFHPACFVCMECNMPFNASSFYEYNNMPYCELHYHTKRGSLCANCQQPINGRCVTAMNKKYHPEHFVCSFCLQYLNKGTFKEQNDKPYCHQCFQHLF
jgi:paxillin